MVMNRSRLGLAFVVVLAIVSVVAGRLSAQTWQSKLVHTGTVGKLEYATDGEGNRIPDFSYAGYRNGAVPIPNVEVVKTINPVPGDNTQSIQSAVNEVALRTPDLKGFRGALYLTAGIYRVAGTIYLNTSGIVLRGAGEGVDSTKNTILLGVGDSPHQRTIIVIGGGSETKWADQVSSTMTNIVTDTVYVGLKMFDVSDGSRFSVGDNIIIYHPCTNAWLTAVNYGGTHWNDPGAAPGLDTSWAVNSQPIVYNRFITKKNGNTITIDVPVFNNLVRGLAQCYIYKYARSGLRTNIGIESLRVDIVANGSTTDASGDENHAWDAIWFKQVEDAWAQHCTTLHFGQSGFKTSTATRVTIDSCSALDPVSIITGERRYNFNVYTASQQILFRNARATYGRHDFVSNGTSWTSGCVFLDCTSENAYASSEGHRRWTTSLLFDNVVFTSPKTSGYILGLYNRGNYGTAHGWALAHSVAWNCNTGSRALVVQKPPTAQNYAIGCSGSQVTGNRPVAPFSEPQGYIEGTNQSGLNPSSLYRAQLAERLSSTTGVNQPEVSTSENVSLEQNYPNPFNPTTTFEFRVSSLGFVALRIFDVLGKEVATLVNEMRQAGAYTIRWDASKLPSGVYFYRLEAGRYVVSNKLMFVK